MVDDVIYEQVEKHWPNYTALDNAASDRTWGGVAGIDAYSLRSTGEERLDPEIKIPFDAIT
jgi:hypothetical protein